jgi:hypothetical protein
MNKFLFVALLIFPISLFAQEKDSVSVCDSIYDFPDVDAQFPGGSKALMVYIGDNYVFPEIFEDFVGKVYLQFLVKQDGTLSEIEVIRKIQPKIDANCIVLIQKMPKWKPATINNKPVCTKVLLPIYISYY